MLLQSALEAALSVVRANPTVLEGLGADLEGIAELLVDLNLFNYGFVVTVAGLRISLSLSLPDAHKLTQGTINHYHER